MTETAKTLATDAMNQLMGEVVTWLNENDDWLKKRFEEVFPLHPIHAACKSDEDARAKAYDLCKDFFVGGAMAAVSRMKEPATKDDIIASVVRSVTGADAKQVGPAISFNNEGDLPELDSRATSAALLDNRTGQIVMIDADSPEELREKITAKVAEINAEISAKAN